jgi:poly(A) polymerase
MRSPQLTARAILAAVPFLDDVRRAAGARRCYLVGGAVRDAFLGRECTDFDFVIGDAPAIARRVAERLGGKLVTLDELHQTSRVVVRRGGKRIDLDFAVPRRAGIAEDLRARDFTVNAVAVGPLGDHPRILDPCDGRGDVARGVVRMTSCAALADDPVRVVRAYRFAATLALRIDRKTRACCRRLAALVPGMAAERLGAEVLLALGGERYETALQRMADDGVLAALIPEFACTMGVEQGGVHEFDVAQHSLLAAARLAEILRKPGRFFPQHAGPVGAYLANDRTRAGLVLATLLHDLGKPERRTWGGRRWRFFGHEQRGAELAELATRRLRLPRPVRRHVKDLVGSHMRLLPFMQTDEPTPRAQRKFMRDLAPHGIGAVLLALADRRALRSTPEFEDDEATLRRLSLLLSAGEDDQAARTHDLPVNGDDLLRLGLTPGPQFGRILEAVGEEWLAGAITTRAEALRWIRREFLNVRRRG